jgi:hypothetical protein
LTNYTCNQTGSKDKNEVGRAIYEEFKGRVPGLARVVNVDNVVETLPGPSIIEGVFNGNPMPWDEIRRKALW